MTIAVALIVLAIYTSRIEHLAVTNRTRIEFLEHWRTNVRDEKEKVKNDFADKVREFNSQPRDIRKISDLPVIYPVLGSVEYELHKAIEENKSLSFQLAEVSKALQEKKILIYEMDEKLSKLDAENLTMSMRLKDCSITLGQVRDFLTSKRPTKMQENAVLSTVNLALSHFTTIKLDKPYLGSSPLTTGGEQFKDMFLQESEELKGFNSPVIKWNIADGKNTPFIPEGEELDADKLNKIFGVSTDLLYGHTGSDPIFEAAKPQIKKLNRAFIPIDYEDIKCSSCPECNNTEYTNKNELGEGSRVCSECKQEWWTDIDYPQHINKSVTDETESKPDYLKWWESLNLAQQADYAINAGFGDAKPSILSEEAKFEIYNKEKFLK
jgi:hypothetical protein